MKRKVGIIGCGHILARHIEAVRENSDNFELVALCDIEGKTLKKAVDENPEAKGFVKYEEMLKEMKGEMNFVVIASPNHLHYEMALKALDEGYDILIEKPIAFEASKVEEIQKRADELGREAYCVLQVRYNPTVKIMQRALEQKLFGDIRCVNFIQRWQRPIGYFSDWRGCIDEGGRSLYEYGIHYLDIVQKFFGIPDVKTTQTFNHKHLDIPFEDTLYSIVEYENGASGTIEVNVAVEPSNLECSISIIGSKGFLKISGNALDKVERVSLESEALEEKWKEIIKNGGECLVPNSYGTHVGSCPNHPILYSEIAEGRGFKVSDASPSIKFIEDLYSKEAK